jgi:hypothetical protein
MVDFEAFCIEFGQKFPKDGVTIQVPSGVAPDEARAAMAYALSEGLTADTGQALQVQYAVWQVLGQNGPAGDVTAQDILTNGTQAPANPQGTLVIDSAKANQIKLTLNSWNPVDQPVQVTATASDNFYGSGQLTIENTSQQPLTLCMPAGAVFNASNVAYQNLAGYATNVQVTNPQAVQSDRVQQLPQNSRRR